LISGEWIMSRCKFSIFAAVLFVSVATCADVHAQWLNAYGQGWYLQPRLEELARHTPYYALFPPVYYSHPVRWPYGCSPFAKLPGPRCDAAPSFAAAAPTARGIGDAGPSSAETARVAPLVIRNPFVPQPEWAAAPEGRSPPAPLVVRNPYVTQPGDGASPAEVHSGSVPLAQVAAPPRIAMPAR
jgi:hypothetical protein